MRAKADNRKTPKAADRRLASGSRIEAMMNRYVTRAAWAACLLVLAGSTARGASPGAYPLVPPSVVVPIPGTQPFFQAPLDSASLPGLETHRALASLRARECGIYDV